MHSNQPEHEGGLFLRLDDPEHPRLRQMLTKEFNVKRTQAMRGQLLEITDELIDAMLSKGGPVDLIEDFALPMPCLAICRWPAPHTPTSCAAVADPSSPSPPSRRCAVSAVVPTDPARVRCSR
ncbi:hypothetical protein [Streptomyces sp. NPDC005374]|uniref:hypothetical protein n=1 Tax=Streptomyces sp. NPDC005374 TaxID=3364713 RepID=UPI00367464A9